MLYRGGGYKTGNMCGYKTGIMCGYKTNHSKKMCGNDCYKTNHSKIWIMGVFAEKNFSVFFYEFKTQYLQKVIFAILTFIRPITRNGSGNDFYKINHSKWERE